MAFSTTPSSRSPVKFIWMLIIIGVAGYNAIYNHELDSTTTTVALQTHTEASDKGFSSLGEKNRTVAFAVDSGGSVTATVSTEVQTQEAADDEGVSSLGETDHTVAFAVDASSPGRGCVRKGIAPCLTPFGTDWQGRAAGDPARLGCELQGLCCDFASAIERLIVMRALTESAQPNTPPWKWCQQRFSKTGSSKARKLEVLKARKFESPEARKPGSPEARKPGSPEVRKPESPEGLPMDCQNASKVASAWSDEKLYCLACQHWYIGKDGRFGQVGIRPREEGASMLEALCTKSPYKDFLFCKC